VIPTAVLDAAAILVAGAVLMTVVVVFGRLLIIGLDYLAARLQR
jgi:hypothetical protein